MENIKYFLVDIHNLLHALINLTTDCILCGTGDSLTVFGLFLFLLLFLLLLCRLSLQVDRWRLLSAPLRLRVEVHLLHAQLTFGNDRYLRNFVHHTINCLAVIDSV